MKTFWEWFYDNPAAILTTLAPAFAALLGLLFRTKKDEQPELSNRLTVFGIVTVLFTCLLVCISFHSQYSDYKVAEIKREGDSLNLVSYFQHIDSSQTVISDQERTHSQNDSIAGATTISKLQLQLTTDSEKIITDSNRYQNMMGGLSAELFQQGLTIQNINKLLHPIFPLTIQATIQINIDRFKPGLNLPYTLEKLKSDQDVRLGKAFIYGSPFEVLQQVKHKYNKQLDPNLDSIEQKINRLIPSYISVEILDDTINRTAVFSTLIDDVHTDYSYEYNFQTKVLVIQVYSDINTENIADNKINTLEGLRNKYLHIKFDNFKFKTPFNLKEFKFYCGQTFFNTYRFNFNENLSRGSTDNDTKSYQISMNEVLSP